MAGARAAGGLMIILTKALRPVGTEFAGKSGRRYRVARHVFRNGAYREVVQYLGEPERRKCNCDKWVLMNAGCKCGGA